MNIDTMQDIIDNIELLKQREITYYDGHWCCFKVDSNGCGSVDNDIRLNDKLFNVLKDCEYIQKDGHTVSHRSVTQFKFSSKFDKVTVTELNQFFLELIQHFHNGDFCNTEKCQQLAQLKEENDILRKRIVTIFTCLIRANRDVIVDTLWVDKITTLWDYIAQTLGIEGDQNQIEEQVEMLYSEGE